MKSIKLLSPLSATKLPLNLRLIPMDNPFNLVHCHPQIYEIHKFNLQIQFWIDGWMTLFFLLLISAVWLILNRLIAVWMLSKSAKVILKTYKLKLQLMEVRESASKK